MSQKVQTSLNVQHLYQFRCEQAMSAGMQWLLTVCSKLHILMFKCHNYVLQLTNTQP